jgi:hypothetical protein
MKSEIVVIGGNSKFIQLYDINGFDPFSNIPFFLKPIRIIWLKYNFGGFSMWVNKKLFKLDDICNTIILFDCTNLLWFTNKIEKLYPTKKLIVFFWNPIFLYNDQVITQISNNWEKWTFDYADSIKYKLKYAGQFFFDKAIDNLKHETEIKYDLFFIGINKGRFKILRPLNNLLTNKYSLQTNFLFVSKYLCWVSHKYSKPISYDKVIEKINQSKAIFEYNQKGQSGLTLRCLEAIWLNKKLVTNNQVLRRYDFYNPQNIFIINDRSWDELVDFLNTPLIEYDNEIKQRYSFTKWLNRIIFNTPLKEDWE